MHEQQLLRLLRDYLQARDAFQVWKQYELLNQLRRYVEKQPTGATSLSSTSFEILPTAESADVPRSLIRP